MEDANQTEILGCQVLLLFPNMQCNLVSLVFQIDLYNIKSAKQVFPNIGMLSTAHP